MELYYKANIVKVILSQFLKFKILRNAGQRNAGIFKASGP